MSKATVCVAFICGAAVGIGGTWQYFKKKYEAQAQEEIESVKESLAKRYEKKTMTIPEKPDIHTIIAERRKAEKEAMKKEMADILKTTGYTPEDGPSGPYVISPNDFGEKPEYERISLTYYADGVVTDDANEVLDDWADLVGPDFMTHFGEYEDDSVFVRNDILKADYEILKDLSPFHDPDD